MKFTKAQEKWVKTRPSYVQKVIRAYPPTTCYKKGNGHYWIHSYDEDKDKNITLKVVHLQDSFMRDWMVFDVSPDSLVPCGCMLKKSN